MSKRKNYIEDALSPMVPEKGVLSAWLSWVTTGTDVDEKKRKASWLTWVNGLHPIWMTRS